jgi:hypothetical protein
MKPEAKEGRFCGNCGGHNLYEYPMRMFCSIRYAQNKDPIVDTLGCCEDWEPVTQECYCVREALKQSKSK